MANEVAKTIASFTEDSPVIKSMVYVIGLANKVGFRPLQGEHSVQYWTEEFIVKAVEYYKGALERDTTRRNNEAYLKAERNVVAPQPTATPDEWQKYGMQLQALRRKYGIGGTQQEV